MVIVILMYIWLQKKKKKHESNFGIIFLVFFWFSLLQNCTNLLFHYLQVK